MTSSESYQNADAAALYALDALEADEHAQFEQALLDSVELNQSVREFEETAATLAYGAPSMPTFKKMQCWARFSLPTSRVTGNRIFKT